MEAKERFPRTPSKKAVEGENKKGTLTCFPANKKGGRMLAPAMQYGAKNQRTVPPHPSKKAVEGENKKGTLTCFPANKKGGRMFALAVQHEVKSLRMFPHALS